MKISLDWLNDFVDTGNISPKKLGDLLTLHTAEVEKVLEEEKNLENIVVGEILEIKKHPHADRLGVCSVTDGKRRYQVVCGASNTYAGMRSAFAKPGAKVKWHGEGELVELEKTKIRGVESEGMLCAAPEIGLEELFEDPNGIIDLKAFSHPPGTPIKKVLGQNDVIFDIDNKSLTHRPDLWGHYGVAREFSVILGKKLKPYVPKAIFPKKGETLSVDIRARDLVPRFAGCFISGIKVSESPAWMRQRLLSVGIRPINNLVDITNYVMTEYGQPMHAYDRDIVKTDTLVVRLAKNGEKVETIDHNTYHLTDKDLIVTNGDEFLGIGGIMGGVGAEIGEKTSNIILEAANWDPTVTRLTSQRLALRSDASQRFEKSLDPSMCEIAVKRAAELIVELCPNAKIASPIVIEGSWKPKTITVPLRLKTLYSKTGKEIPATLVKKILTALECGVKEKNKEMFEITVPSHRVTRDLLIEDDLIEEVARIYGYENIETAVPSLPVKVPTENSERRLKHEARKILSLGLGMSEVYNYSFYSEEDVRRCALSEKEHITLKNHLSEEQSHLRTSLLPRILRNVQQNAKCFDAFKLYEIGRIYREVGTYMPEEKKIILGAVVPGKKTRSEPFYAAKGIVEAFLKKFAVPYEHSAAINFREAHPAKCETIRFKKNTLARYFELNPTVAKNYEIDRRIGIFEIDFETLLSAVQISEKVFRPLPRYPENVFDISVIVEKKRPVEDIRKLIKECSEELIENIRLFDTFEGPQIGEGKKALAFSVSLRSDERTLGDDEMTNVQQKIFDALIKTGGEIRGL